MAAALNGKLGAITGTLRDFVTRAKDPDWSGAVRTELRMMPMALRSALPWLIRARDENDESLVKVVMDNAASQPAALAFEMDDVRLTWADVDGLTSKVAHILSELGVEKGDVVALLGSNSPMYIVLVLACSRVGATAALVNNHLEGTPLAHAIRTSTARVALVEKRYLAALEHLAELRPQLRHVLSYGDGDLEQRILNAPRRPFARVPIAANSDYVYIYTSGTTGLPKPCRVTHARSLIAAAGFSVLMFEFRPGDKLYSVLPLYHSSALLLGVGSCVMTRTPMAMRESFSTRAFWSDVRRYNATAMLYIGELCRYLLNSPETPEEKRNPIRVAVGNGLRADVWEPFQQRFGIPLIREFYSATEAPGAIFNLTGKVGSVGRVPFRRLSALKLALYDVENDELVKSSNGFCQECGPGQVGELLIQIDEKPRTAMSEFRGYTDPDATRRKILTDVFEKGDRFFRSGDLMRFDENDYFYFVDRIGDTYRWKGENVSTSEVAEVLSAAPGVRETTVSGVRVPGAEGQAGLAAVVIDGEFDAAGFWTTAQGLPSYAQPRFVRVLKKMHTTGTFKIQKTQLRHDGVDPTRLDDPIYIRQDDGYVPLTAALWHDVTQGRARL